MAPSPGKAKVNGKQKRKATADWRDQEDDDLEDDLDSSPASPILKKSRRVSRSPAMCISDSDSDGVQFDSDDDDPPWFDPAKTDLTSHGSGHTRMPRDELICPIAERDAGNSPVGQPNNAQIGPVSSRNDDVREIMLHFEDEGFRRAFHEPNPTATDEERRADDEARRKQLRSAGSPFQYSNVTSKWRRVCENQYILDEVAERVVILQQVKMEATHVANLHCLRHFEHKYRPRSWRDREAKLVLNNTFFYRCCVGVLLADDGAPPRRCTDGLLEETLAEYRAEREKVSGYKPPRLSYASASLVELANAMVVNAANHITIHFNRRLSRCLELSFQLGRREMRVMLARLQREDCEFTVAENEVLDWLQELPNENNTKGIPGHPTEANIKKYPVHFLGKMYDMLMLLEETVASTDRTPRGCKLFSILPVTTSFVPSYITINTTVLYDMGKRIMKQKSVDVFNLFKRTDTKGVKVYATTGEFQAMRHRIWPEFLRVDRHTSKKKDPELGILRRKFEYQVQTNGYGAAVLTSIPAKVSRNPSVEYKPHTVIGIDPGKRS
ncbi:hypothetical protein BBJ28_00024045, partial [Nothophytophthora sp. Chile5]